MGADDITSWPAYRRAAHGLGRSFQAARLWPGLTVHESVTVAVDESGDIAVPDFAGKTMRDVTDQCLRLGLNPSLVGSNLAIAQSPEPGAMVKHGAKVTVEFGIPEMKTSRAHSGIKK